MLPRNSGAGDESRTRDLNLGKVALYQLSYSRMGPQGLAGGNSTFARCKPFLIANRFRDCLINLVIDQKARILHDFFRSCFLFRFFRSCLSLVVARDGRIVLNLHAGLRVVRRLKQCLKHFPADLTAKLNQVI